MSNIKPFIFGAVVGAVIIPIIGFSALGWKFNSKAQAMADDATNVAMKEALVPVCVAQFRADAEASANLVELKAEKYSHSRSEFIRTGGWAIAPGHSEPATGVPNACANALIAEK